MAVQHNATVTVSEAVDGTVPEKRRWRPNRNGPVTTWDVHPATLKCALDIAGGDKARLQFNDDGSIIVHNHAGQRFDR